LRGLVYFASGSGTGGGGGDIGTTFNEGTAYSASRPGELFRSLTDRSRDVINVGDYAQGGIYPWNINDDSDGIDAAIIEANARINAGGKAVLWFPAKNGVAGYRVTRKLSAFLGGDVIMDAPILVHSSQAVINDFVFTIGDPGYRTIECEMRLWMSTYGPGTDYTVNLGFSAFKLINLNRSYVKIRSVLGFQICVQLLSTGVGQYTSGNVFDLGYIDGRWMLDLVADGANCWMISNTFRGGQFGHNANGVDRAGIRCRLLNGALNMHDLRFINPDIEVGSSEGRGDAFRCDVDAATANHGASIYIENAYLEGFKKLAYSNPTNHGYISIYGTANRADTFGTLELDEWGPMGSVVTFNGMEQGYIPVDPRIVAPRIWWSPSYSFMTKAAADAQGLLRVSAVNDVMGGAPLIETGTTGPFFAGDSLYNARSGLWFDGATRWLKTGTQTLLTTLGSTAAWRCKVDFIAYKASASGDQLIGDVYTGGTQFWAIGVYTTGSSQPRIYALVTDSVSGKEIDVPIFIGVRYVAEFWYANGQLNLRVNGFVAASLAAGVAATTSRLMQVGTGDNTNFFSGEIYDIVFF
jgi:hypothetical protein